MFTGLSTKCGSVGGVSSDGDNDTEPVQLAIVVVVTFVVTALSVSFLATVIGLFLNAQKKKKEGFKKEYELDNVYERNVKIYVKFCYYYNQLLPVLSACIFLIIKINMPCRVSVVANYSYSVV